MNLIIIIIIIIPGIISVAIHNFINRTESIKISSYLIRWSIFTFLISLASYGALFVNNNHDTVNITLNEGADIFRVGFVFKYMVIGLISSLLLPILFFLLK